MLEQSARAAVLERPCWSGRAGAAVLERPCWSGFAEVALLEGPSKCGPVAMRVWLRFFSFEF